MRPSSLPLFWILGAGAISPNSANSQIYGDGDVSCGPSKHASDVQSRSATSTNPSAMSIPSLCRQRHLGPKSKTTEATESHLLVRRMVSRPEELPDIPIYGHPAHNVVKDQWNKVHQNLRSRFLEKQSRFRMALDLHSETPGTNEFGHPFREADREWHQAMHKYNDFSEKYRQQRERSKAYRLDDSEIPWQNDPVMSRVVHASHHDLRSSLHNLDSTRQDTVGTGTGHAEHNRGRTEAYAGPLFHHTTSSSNGDHLSPSQRIEWLRHHGITGQLETQPIKKGSSSSSRTMDSLQAHSAHQANEPDHHGQQPHHHGQQPDAFSELLQRHSHHGFVPFTEKVHTGEKSHFVTPVQPGQVSKQGSTPGSKDPSKDGQSYHLYEPPKPRLGQAGPKSPPAKSNTDSLMRPSRQLQPPRSGHEDSNMVSPPSELGPKRPREPKMRALQDIGAPGTALNKLPTHQGPHMPHDRAQVGIGRRPLSAMPPPASRPPPGPVNDALGSRQDGEHSTRPTKQMRLDGPPMPLPAHTAGFRVLSPGPSAWMEQSNQQPGPSHARTQQLQPQGSVRSQGTSSPPLHRWLSDDNWSPRSSFS